MYDKDQDFAKFASFALMAGLVAAPFTGGFSLLGVVIGLIALRLFTNSLP
jgi:hypothetical protein